MKGFIVLNQKEAHRGHVLEQVAQKISDFEGSNRHHGRQLQTSQTDPEEVALKWPKWAATWQPGSLRWPCDQLRVGGQHIVSS